MALRAVLFDWGGTIVREDSLSAGQPYVAIANYAAKHMSLALTAEEFERAFQAVLPAYEPGVTVTTPRISSVIGSAFTWLGCAAGAGDVDTCSRLFFREVTAPNQVFDDARALLASLKYRGYRCGVITNAIFPAPLFVAKANELGLGGYFETFVTSGDVGLAKPNPAPFVKALADLGLEPQDALFVGDTVETDIAGARAAGMRAVLIERTDRARDRAGFLVIERLTSLNDFLGEGPAG